MDSKNRILNRGGFTAALICLFVSACGPNGGGDSGMMTDAGPFTGDSGPDMPDTGVPPDVDGGMPTDDGGTDSGTTPTCSAAEVASRTPGCGEQYDLPSGMAYTDTAMLVECMSTLTSGNSWATTGASGCITDLARESETGQWIMMLDCPGAGDSPYGGIYRLGADGKFYGNCGNRAMPGEQGNCGILTPDADCRGLVGEFFHGGETVPYNTQSYWM